MVAAFSSIGKVVIMDALLNPFHENYIMESTSPEDFVEVFSPLHLEVLRETLALYQPGDVVLTGVQGSGKSMLLALLRPEILLAYAAKETDFPVPRELGRFVGAGINLTRSGASDFGQRTLGDDDDPSVWPLYFGDFLNYWIVRDLLSSLKKLMASPIAKPRKEIGLNDDPSVLQQFANCAIKNDCWFGYLSGADSFQSLEQALSRRINAYRGFLNYNSPMPVEISESKTRIGEPVSVVAECLRLNGVLPNDVECYIQIDQYEELCYLEDWSRQRKLYHDYRSIIHKLLSRRDSRVSYRIGTRSHAWPSVPQIYSTGANVEELRNYKRVDLDDILRRQENRPWLFPRFAGDVFERRLVHGGYDPSSLQQVFGKPLPAEQRARNYAGSDPSKAVVVDEKWPPAVQTLLSELAVENPLSAKLGEGWVRQQAEQRNPTFPTVDSFPWELEAKQWWKKERIDQALLQIAARRRQKLQWAGDSEILDLTAGNILAFVDLCQFIWAAWLRSLSDEAQPKSDAGVIARIENHLIQNEGVQHVSSHWYRKIRSEYHGDSRMRFVTNIGNQFRVHLRDDLRMSYPGFNGFSVPQRELDEDPEIFDFLREAEGYGVLIGAPHTSRTKSRGECRKWYLHPILCPHFQIPTAHTKEPMEVHARDVRQWLIRSEVFKAKSGTSTQPTLFDLHEGQE
jgi:hypothetical protein